MHSLSECSPRPPVLCCIPTAMSGGPWHPGLLFGTAFPTLYFCMCPKVVITSKAEPCLTHLHRVPVPSMFRAFSGAWVDGWMDAPRSRSWR